MAVETSTENSRKEWLDNLQKTERMLMRESRLLTSIEEERKARKLDQTEITIDDEDVKCSQWYESMIRAYEMEQTQSEDVKPRIPKVTPVIAQEFRIDSFMPKVISIGPYYYSKSELKLMQDLKSLLALRFVSNIKYVRISSLCQAIMSKIDEVRLFYDKDLLKDLIDEKLVEIMFLDGCFLLYFADRIFNSDLENLGMSNYQLEQVHQDLRLMENQIPYQVLLCLDENIDYPYLFFFNFYIHTRIHASFVGFPNLNKYDTSIHLLDGIRKSLIGESSVRNERIGNDKNGPMLRNVKELAAVEIYFKANGTGTINDISFRSFGIYGRLSLPMFTFDSSTKSLLLNLIAYEMCSDKSVTDFTVVSYICFLDSLIDNAEDVKELRSAGIIRNNLNSDEEVAELINGIGAKLVPDGDTLVAVKEKMQKYLTSKSKVKIGSWFAQVIRNHFRSPLTIFIVLAATFAIFLTAVQTYYTVFK